MPQIAFLFSGPGSAMPQMGRDLYNKVLPVREAMDKADKLFAAENFKVTKACFLGSAEDLSRPSLAGPAELAIAYGICAALKAKHVQPQMLAGYGWGEVTALACLGALPFEEALHFLRVRGLLLEAAWQKAPFHVAALSGMGAEEARAKFAPLPKQPLVVADDAPDACVIAASEELLKKLLPLLASKTVKTTAPAPGWAWPHPFLDAAASEVAAEFGKMKLERSGGWDFFSAAEPGRVAELQAWGALQAQSTVQPIRFRECALAMRASGMDTLVEIGPSEALGAFTRKLDTGVRALATLDSKALSSALKLAV